MHADTDLAPIAALEAEAALYLLGGSPDGPPRRSHVCCLVMLGYTACFDPPKISAASALHALAGRGVAVRMLSGHKAGVRAHVHGGLILTQNSLVAVDDGVLAGRTAFVHIVKYILTRASSNFGLLRFCIGARTDIALFQTCWFVGSLLSQTMIVYVIRTRMPGVGIA